MFLYEEIMLPEWVAGNVGHIYTFAVRYILAILAVFIIVRCGCSLFSEKNEKEIWGYLSLPNSAKIEINHWENIIGRARHCDIVLDYPTMSRAHCALIRDSSGEWTVYDLDSKGGVVVRGHKMNEPTKVKDGDIIDMAGVETVFMDISSEAALENAGKRTKPGKVIRPGITLVLLSFFIVFLTLQLMISAGESFILLVPLSFLALIVLMWICFFMNKAIKRAGFEIETIGFFLTTIGCAIIASSAPEELLKQMVCTLIGIILFWILGWFLRDLDRSKKVRWPMAAIGLMFLVLNIFTAESIFGAKNWISIGGISFQPSEFVKICFIFSGAATLDRLFAKRNIIMFILFAGACVGCLALMSDFGTAAVFFAAYIVVAFMRSGSFAAILLSVSGAAFAAFAAITLKPYIADRFSSWGRAWELANAEGYQQVRTMSSAASGGLFGLGAGNGWLKTVFAADTDMVFGMVCEELGLIIALLTVIVIVIMAFFVIRSTGTARSSYYSIAACATVTIFIFQLMLNVFGSLDILPFTGVTFPFVSNGGSSLVSCWGMLAFIKAIDTRQNASFAIRLPKGSYKKAGGRA